MVKLYRVLLMAVVISMVVLPPLGCGFITIGDDDVYPSSKLRPQDFAYARFEANWPRLDNPGYKYLFEEIYIPINWNGNTFNGSYAGDSAGRVSGYNRCNISGTVSTDAKVLQQCTFTMNLTSSDGEGQALNISLQSLPLDNNYSLIYRAINTDCAKYVTAFTPTIFTRKSGTQPLPVNWASDSLIHVDLLNK